MTALSLSLLRTLQSGTPKEAWSELFALAWETCLPELSAEKAANDVSNRDRALAPADLFLATAGWDLWEEYYASVSTTAGRLAEWWNQRSPGRAVLILDALSLREAPWLVHGANARGFKVHFAGPTGAELPADTTPFAKALGFGQRSALENNDASGTHKLQGAKTDSVDLPWAECVDLIDASPDWCLWHHWPDDRIHDLASPGSGVSALAKEVATQLASDEFWKFIGRLATGRRLIITGDHGYAATGLFSDAANGKAQHLKSRFKSGRSASDDGAAGEWVPPIDIVLETPHGRHAFALGRRKWKSQGGYPTLAHGGLSLLEVAVPFIELSMPGGN